MAFSLHRFPIFSILATVIGLAGVCLFLITFYSGSDLSIKLLRDIFQYNDNDVEFMEYYQIGFSLIAAFTTVVILLVLLLDYLVTTSTYTGKPMYEFLAGSTPPFVIAIIALVLIGLWIWVYVKIDRLLIIYTILERTCNSDYTKSKFSAAEDNCMTFDYYSTVFPLSKHVRSVCGPVLQRFCEDFILKTRTSYLLALIGSGLVIVGLWHVIVCLVAIYAKEEEKTMGASLKDDR